MKKAVPLLLIILVISAFAATAHAWAPEFFYKSFGDMPEDVRAALPQDMVFASGFKSGLVYAVMQASDLSRVVYTFEEDESGSHRLLLATQPILPVNGAPVTVGGGADVLYLMTSELPGGVWCASFQYKALSGRQWQLSGVQGSDNYAVTEWGISESGGANRRMYGTALFNQCLYDGFHETYGAFDLNKIPASFDEACCQIDTDSIVMVKSYAQDDRLNIRAKPSKDAVSLGKLYSGAPLSISSGDKRNTDKWTHVWFGYADGYAMTEYLAFGRDMPDVPIYFPNKTLTEEAETSGAPLYAWPDTGSEIMRTFKHDSEYWIIGDYGDDWYIVSSSFYSGQTGYMEKKWFWDGNG